MYLEIVLCIILGALALHYTINKQNIFNIWKIPQASSLPLVGSMLPVLLQRTSIVEHLSDIYYLNKTAKYIGLYHFSKPVILLRDPELIKTIMIRAFHHFTDHQGFIEPEQDPFFGAFMFALKGNEWKRLRTRLSSTFTTSKIKSMHSLMTKCADSFGDHVVNQFLHQPGDIDAKDAFSRCTTDIIATCEYGCEVDSMKNRDNDFYILGKRTVDFNGPISKKLFLATSFPGLTKLFNIKMIEQKAVDFFVGLVKETIQLRREKDIRRPDMLEIMMDTNNEEEMELSLNAMAAQAFAFFVGSFDTLSTMLCFGFYALAKNREVQERLYAEVEEVLKRTGGKPSYEDVNEMTYLEAVINESIRCHTSAAFVDRVCTKSFELPPATDDGKPVVIQPGQIFWIPIREVHLDAKYHQRPELFDPERFLGETKKSIIPGTYIPFGNGPRACLGQRFALHGAKIVFFHLIARCEFFVSDKMKEPLEYSRRSFTLQPEGGFWLKVRVRDSWKTGIHKLLVKGESTGVN